MNVKKVNAKQLKKGMIVAAQGSFEPTNHFDVRCFKNFILILYSEDVCNTYFKVLIWRERYHSDKIFRFLVYPV